jgi:hypothetical protein
LAVAPSSQRCTCPSVTTCWVVGSRTSISNGVEGPICEVHGSPLKRWTPRIAAS